MKNKNNGFIKIIILIIVALALAKFIFDFDILEFLNTPKVQETIAYIWGVILIVWYDFIVRPVVFIWEWVKGFID